MGGPLSPLILDLCEVAAYVYLGDKAVPRGRYEKWVRDLSFYIPVREPEPMERCPHAAHAHGRHTVGRQRTVSFPPEARAEAAAKTSDHSGAASNNAAAGLRITFLRRTRFSAGTLYLVKAGRRPLLASHYASGLRSLQGNLAQALGGELGQTFPHFQYRVSGCRRKRTRHLLTTPESSHRARSFMFLGFAAAAAEVRGLSEIFICENGVLSLNVPISDAYARARARPITRIRSI